ncbi:hypothetical protein A2115_03055 [Candidatus Woesebacteria bacterium GWA1_41_8]|uniref:Methyltransferase type 11 domain-containing protein n=1 Tax=Candidatus Woesebacteria bacterium GWA1_41_8 TaxID=1802471 RepID=A0A1F7WK58_9BACT|nr:MAG: hypothetical protein A2115_03055 [Candidatus Woesebacteria bacterium GWA1_41_8]
MKKCLICGHKAKVERGSQIGDFFYETCLSCGGATLGPREMAIKQSRRVYNAEYFNWGRPKGLKKIIYSLYLHKDYPDWIEEERHGLKGRILDIGAGVPTFLENMGSRGWEVFAQELSRPQGVKIAKSIGADKVFIGDFEKINLPKKYFDVVTFWHVLEHVKFPPKTIQKAAKLLKPGGQIFVEVPNFNSLSLKIMKSNYSLLSIPAHLFYYNSKSLRRLFTNCGFKTEAVYYPLKYNLTFSGSLLRALQNKIGNAVVFQIIFYMSAFISLPISILSSFLGMTEVIRVVAKKRN